MIIHLGNSEGEKKTVRGLTITMFIDHLLKGMILQVSLQFPGINGRPRYRSMGGWMLSHIPGISSDSERNVGSLLGCQEGRNWCCLKKTITTKTIFIYIDTKNAVQNGIWAHKKKRKSHLQNVFKKKIREKKMWDSLHFQVVLHFSGFF